MELRALPLLLENDALLQNSATYKSKVRPSNSDRESSGCVRQILTQTQLTAISHLRMRRG